VVNWRIIAGLELSEVVGDYCDSIIEIKAEGMRLGVG